jgi:hypothetical protein
METILMSLQEPKQPEVFSPVREGAMTLGEASRLPGLSRTASSIRITV